MPEISYQKYMLEISYQTYNLLAPALWLEPQSSQESDNVNEDQNKKTAVISIKFYSCKDM